jgi:hypothetical protein
MKIGANVTNYLKDLSAVLAKSSAVTLGYLRFFNYPK